MELSPVMTITLPAVQQNRECQIYFCSLFSSSDYRASGVREVVMAYVKRYWGKPWKPRVKIARLWAKISNLTLTEHGAGVPATWPCSVVSWTKFFWPVFNNNWALCWNIRCLKLPATVCMLFYDHTEGQKRMMMMMMITWCVRGSWPQPQEAWEIKCCIITFLFPMPWALITNITFSIGTSQAHVGQQFRASVMVWDACSSGLSHSCLLRQGQWDLYILYWGYKKKYSRAGWSKGNAVDLYLEDTWFGPWPGHCLSCSFALPPITFQDSALMRPQPLLSKCFRLHHSFIILPSDVM